MKRAKRGGQINAELEGPQTIHVEKKATFLPGQKVHAREGESQSCNFIKDRYRHGRKMS